MLLPPDLSLIFKNILLIWEETTLKKIKNSSTISIMIDHELWIQAKNNMQTSLYGKYLRKALPLDQAKLALADT